MTNEELVKKLSYGCTFASNGDAAHTDGYPEALDEIIASVESGEWGEIERDSEDFILWASRLDYVSIVGDENSEYGWRVTEGELPNHIYQVGEYYVCAD